MKTYVLYYSNCRDGFTAAWAAWKKLGKNATYIPCSYQKPVPEMEDGSRVFILDFSFPRETTVELANRMFQVIVIDHHKSAQQQLSDLPGFDESSELQVHIDMEKSGARLAWEFFHGPKQVPKIVDFVEDRDLWRFRFQATRAFGAYLSSLEMDFGVWDDNSKMAETSEGLKNQVRQGSAILRFMQKEINRMAWGRVVYNVNALDVERKAVVVNGTCFFSELGEHLLEQEPEADFAVVYGDNHSLDKTLYSLRSRTGSDMDVSKIAEYFGGGGHKHAAGFKIDINERLQINSNHKKKMPLLELEEIL